MTKMQMLSVIDNLIEQHHLLNHPFYQAWNAGKLSMSALQDYACQYYHHVATFPTYLSAVHAQTDNQQTRRHLLQNLIDEEAGSPNHPDLWLMFAKSLGLHDQEVVQTPLWEETRNLIDCFRSNCADEGTTAGIAALYAYESQIPEVAKTKIEGMKKYYGLESEQATEYFRIHIEADEEHPRIERDLLKNHLDKNNHRQAMLSAEQVLTSLWDMLSAVCRRHNIQ